MKKLEISSLFGLRAVAALFVALFHLNFFTGIGGFALLPGADIAPDVFFILSGFVLAYQYDNFSKELSLSSYIEYIVKRFYRIWPSIFFVYLFGSILFLTLSVATNNIGFSIIDFVQKFFTSSLLIATMTHVWFSFDRLEMRNYLWDRINVPLWSVSAEWFGYLVFPFLLTIAKNKVINLCCIAIVGGALMLFISTETDGLMHCLYGYKALTRVIYGFLIGIFFCKIKNEFNITNTAGLFLCISSLFISALIVLFFPDRMRGLVIFLMGVLILSLTLEHPISNFLSCRFMIYCGKLSYGFYLVHWLVLSMSYYATNSSPAFRQGRQSLLFNLNPALLYLLFFSICITAAIFIYHYIENPARKRLLSFFNSYTLTSLELRNNVDTTR